MLAGEVDAGREGLRQVAAAANAAGRPADAVRAVLAMGSGVGGFEVDIGDTSQEHLLTSALAALREDDLVTRAAGLARLSVVRTLLATPEERATQAREALTLAAASGDPTVEAAALAALNDAIAGPDHVADRLHGADRIIAIADHESDTPLALLGLRLRLVARLESGDLTGVDHDIAEYDVRAQRLRLPIYSWPVPLWRGMRAAMDGDYETALSRADEVDRLGRESGSANAAMMAWTLRLQHAKATGSPIAFAALLADIAHWSVEPSQWDCCFASIYAHSGVFDKARHHMDRITTAGLDTIPKDSEWVELMWQLAEAALLLADRKVAEEIRGRLAPYADLWAVDGIGGACFGRVADMVARLDELLERPEPGAAPQQPESTESAELRRDGRVWQVAFRGRQATIPHSKGHGRPRDTRGAARTGGSRARPRRGRRRTVPGRGRREYRSGPGPSGARVVPGAARGPRRGDRHGLRRRRHRQSGHPRRGARLPAGRAGRCPRAVRSRSSYRRPGRACPQGGHDAHRHRPEGNRGSPSRARAAPATVGVHRTLLLLPARAAGHVANLTSRRDDATPDVAPPW